MSIAPVLPAFIDQFRPAIGAEPARLGHARAAALAQFRVTGLPTRADEAWRFTELGPLAETSFRPGERQAHPAGLAAALARWPADIPADRVVLVNGRYRPEYSQIGALPDGVVLGAFADWAARHPDQAAPLLEASGGVDQAFLTLSAGLYTDGFVLVVPAGVVLDRPVRVVHWGEAAGPETNQIRALIRLEAGAGATILESWAGRGAYWNNAGVTVELGDGARLGHYKLQEEAPEAFHTAHLGLIQGAGSQYDGFALSLGGRIARQDILAELAGTAAHCALNGAYLLAGRQESTTAIVVEHQATQTSLEETHKGCVADRAHGVFLGCIKVRPGAQKTDAKQVNKTVLLGNRAVMDTKPELEILADDVKCSHGASVGDLDETALFYLRSRGIEPETARRMLIEAFVIETVELVGSEPARAVLGTAIRDWLGAREAV